MDTFQGHVSVPLSSYAQRYRNNELLADIVAPRVPVGRQSDFYWIHGRDHMTGADVDDVRPPTGEAQLIKRSLSKDTYFCPDHSLADMIADEEPLNNEAEDPKVTATRIIMDRLMLRREKRVATLLTTAANFASGLKVTLAGNDQWSSADVASQPIADVQAAVTAVELAAGVTPNYLILGKAVYDALRQHATLVERVKYTKTGGRVDLSDLAQLFGVQNVVVGKAIQRSDAGVNTFVWGKHAVLLYAQATSTADVSAAKTFEWTSAPGTVGGFQVHSEEARPLDRKATRVAAHWYHSEKVTCQEGMYLIENAIA